MENSAIKTWVKEEQNTGGKLPWKTLEVWFKRLCVCV